MEGGFGVTIVDGATGAARKKEAFRARCRRGGEEAAPARGVLR
jgi:hypothetical protein